MFFKLNLFLTSVFNVNRLTDLVFCYTITLLEEFLCKTKFTRFKTDHTLQLKTSNIEFVNDEFSYERFMIGLQKLQFILSFSSCIT